MTKMTRDDNLLVPPAAEESIGAQTKIDSAPNLLPHAVPVRQTSDTSSSQVAFRQTNLRRLSLACLLLAPLVALPPATRVVVDRVTPMLADVATATLDRLLAWRPLHAPTDPDAVAAEPLTLGPAESSTYENETITPERTAPRGRTRAGGILVRANAVVQAVRRGGRPSSVPAPASGPRPAGLSLLGVSHYGTGLRDGDILTQVGSTRATSEGAVIGIVAGAISQGAKVITGVVWRGEQRLDVAVEIPGPEAFRTTPGRSSARQ